VETGIWACNLKIGFFGQKTSCLIFQPPLWWLESRLADDTSSALVGNMLPAFFFKKNRLSTPLEN